MSHSTYKKIVNSFIADSTGQLETTIIGQGEVPPDFRAELEKPGVISVTVTTENEDITYEFHQKHQSVD